MNFLATRRNLLAGIAASSVAAVAHSEKFSSNDLEENPKLVELGDALANFSETHDTAKAARKRAYADAMSRWPEAPEDLVTWMPPKFGWGGIHDVERDVAGAGHNSDCPKRGSKRVISAKFLREKLSDAKSSLAREIERKRPRKAQMKYNESCLASCPPLLSLAEKYEAECARIRSEVDYEALAERTVSAAETLHAHIDAIMKEPAHTMLGVIIKAQALKCWGKADRVRRLFNVQGADWADEMALSVIQQAEAG